MHGNLNRRLGLLAAAALAVAIVVTACGGGAEPTATPTTAPAPTATKAPSPTPAPTATAASPQAKRGGILRLRVTSDPRPWNILGGAVSPSLMVPMPVLNSLVQSNYPGNDIVGDLAERWTMSEDGKEITFELAAGVKWHDGKPLTASDVKFNLDRVFFGAGGFTSLLRGFFTAVQEVEVIDDLTLKVILKQPSNSFLANMTHPMFVIYAPQVPDDELAQGKLVGTGPFVLEQWDVGVSITQGKNPSYFQKDELGEPLPYLDGLKFFIIPSPAAHLAAFLAGRIDVYDQFSSPELMGRIKNLRESTPGLESGLLPPTVWRTLYLKNEPGLPFADVNVRRAMQFGLDRQQFVDVAWRGIGVASGLAMPSPEMGGKWGPTLSDQKQLPGNDPARIAQDQALARELLAKSGYGPDNKLKIEIAVLAFGIFPDEATTLSELYKPLNIEVVLKTEDVATQNRRLQVGLKGNFETLYRPSAFAIDDPSNVVGRYWFSVGPSNYSGWSDPKVDQWYQQQDSTPDPALRAKLVKDILLRIYDQAYDLVIAWNSNPWVKRPEIENYTPPNPFSNGWRYERVWIDR